MSTHRVVVGAFDSEGELLTAAQAAHKGGLSIYDAYTPFPVHGMDQALGIPRSPLSKICFWFGAAGLLLTLAFQYWVSLFDWPMNIGGKSYNASPALLPVAFELTVLSAALGTAAAFFRLRRMSPIKQPDFLRLGGVDDRFVLALLQSGDGDAAVLRRFLQKHGAKDIEESAFS